MANLAVPIQPPKESAGGLHRNIYTDSPLFHRIVPVDFNSTGILEKNKKYSEGMQQFLEMKHQLSVSDFTLTTNYMSNFSFYNRFGQIHGLTGTLGNEWDRHG